MKKYTPKNILVTGSAGFIGSNFVRSSLDMERCAKDGDLIKIISLDKLTYAGNMDNLKNLPNEQQHIFVQGDICDRELVRKIFKDNDIDTIVHFAAQSHVDRSIDFPEEFVHTNVVGTFTLLDEAKRYWTESGKLLDNQKCRFHHISTDEVYGDLQADDPAFTEKTPYAPSSPYSATKASSDHLVRAYFRTYGLPITMSNCSNNYGPRQHPEKFIPTVIRNCMNQNKIPVYGKGSNVRDWLYVMDHCKAIWSILNFGTSGETYNIGGNTEMDNLSLAMRVCAIMDLKRPGNAPHDKLISFVLDRPGHDFRYAINNNKIKGELNWKPEYRLEEALEITIDHYLMNE